MIAVCGDKFKALFVVTRNDVVAQVEDPAGRLRCTVDYLNELMYAPALTFEPVLCVE